MFWTEKTSVWLKNTLRSDEIPAVKPLKSKVILAVWEFANAKNPSYAACVQIVRVIIGGEGGGGGGCSIPG
jgi:hypothetical protein